MKKITLSPRAQIDFFQKLGSLISAQVPIITVLELLKNQSRAKEHILYEKIIADVSLGKNLSTSLAAYTNFNTFIINMIKIGESHGELSRNLKQITKELQTQEQLKRNIVSSLIYPGFIALATLLLSCFLLFYIFPQIRPVLISLSVQLPLSTRILIAVSTFLQRYGIWLIIIGIIAGITYFISLKRYPQFKRVIHGGILKIPILGRIIIMYELFHILRALGYIYGSGSDIKHAIGTSKAVAHNICFKDMIIDLEAHVDRGVLISKTLNNYPILVPTTANQLLAIAETTGTLSETCIILSDMYEQQTESIIKKLSHILEPLLMITMGLIVGFISLAMITPIYSISQKLHP